MAESFSRYDVYTVTGSIYCYRDTNVLRNRLGIRDNQQLRIVEADITAVRQNDLLETPILGRFTSNHLCRIHKYLFGDVYPFAGHFRKEDIMKGATRFLSHKEIAPKLSALLKKLKDENYLRNLSAEKLTSRSAYYLAELNYIHPFREGNGRSIREFMRLLYAQMSIGMPLSRRCCCGRWRSLCIGRRCWKQCLRSAWRSRVTDPLAIINR